mmetsp:Transcript_23565/g.66612  ORF Transcript_23565/g.66612 Transcript_23565/m.66612 type:complete len:410 (-) Transcript_23565:147-1376(-)|eukprot:CAMPEP_0119561342 /NCGR_PEP_ID=MMETSP1352-20130426/17278_1 /TAXON_ID=265584 /ORGANISM="Stauroneis constricta, Strain CCMP1120" /LENGTH=409 /DNA_ID=CAMNT_0007609519 /DNA_START=106 /DNA_END=1335 /DNA_ORIENTATION=+
MAEDRTSEFLALARSVPPGGAPSLGSSSIATSSSLAGNAKGRYSNDKSTAATGKNANAYAQLRTFHTTAGGISRDIAATSQLLGELTNLVRQKSLFTDDSQKVNNLVVRIKSNIENLNGRLDEAGVIITQQKRALGKNSQAGQEATNLVGQLKEEFGQAAVGFKKVLQERTDTLKETSDRKRQVYGDDTMTAGKNSKSSNGPQSLVSLENKPPVYEDVPILNLNGPPAGFPTLDLTSGMAAGEDTSSGAQLPRPHGAESGMRLRKAGSDTTAYGSNVNSGNSGYYGRSDSTPLTPYDIQRMEQESGTSQMMQLIPDQEYLQERANAMEQVESNIVELGTIFNKLAVMVSEHNVLTQRIEDNVEDANSSINLSLATLTDTLTNLQTNRQLFFKVFGVLVVFIIMFIMFFA